MKTIEARVYEIIEDVTGCAQATIEKQSNLSTDLGMDSLELVELVIELETEYQIEIPDDEVEDWRTVQNVIECVTLHVKY